MFPFVQANSNRNSRGEFWRKNLEKNPRDRALSGLFSVPRNVGLMWVNPLGGWLISLSPDNQGPEYKEGATGPDFPTVPGYSRQPLILRSAQEGGHSAAVAPEVLLPYCNRCSA